MEAITFQKYVEKAPEPSRLNLGLPVNSNHTNNCLNATPGSSDQISLEELQGPGESFPAVNQHLPHEAVNQAANLIPNWDNSEQNSTTVTPIQNNSHHDQCSEKTLEPDQTFDEEQAYTGAMMVEQLDYSPEPLERNKYLTRHIASLCYLLDFQSADDVNMYCDAILQKYAGDQNIETIAGIYKTAKLMMDGQVQLVLVKLDELRSTMNNASAGECQVLYLTWKALVEFMSSSDPAIHHDLISQALQIADSQKVSLPKILALRNRGTSDFLVPTQKDPDHTTWWIAEKYLGYAHQATIGCLPDLENDDSIPINIHKSLHAGILFAYMTHLFRYYPMPLMVFNHKHIPEIPKENMCTIKNSFLQLKSMKKFLHPIHRQMYLFFKCDYLIRAVDLEMVPESSYRDIHFKAEKLLMKIPNYAPATHDEQAKEVTSECIEYRREYIERQQSLLLQNASMSPLDRIMDQCETIPKDIDPCDTCQLDHDTLVENDLCQTVPKSYQADEMLYSANADDYQTIPKEYLS